MATELPRGEALFRAMFEQAALGVALIETATGRFVRVNQSLCDLVGYPREELEFSPAPESLNVLMIVIDSWRFDMLQPDVTPNIWKFAAQSAVYNNHFSASNCTRFGIFSLFYGLGI